MRRQQVNWSEKNSRIRRSFLAAAAVFLLGGCSPAAQTGETAAAVETTVTEEMAAETASQEESRETDVPADLGEGFAHTGTLDLIYADGFSVDYYAEDYALISIKEEGQYLVVPEGKEVPENIPENAVVLQAPVEQIYLAASSAMDMFDALDAVDQIRFSARRQEDWYVESAQKAMEEGKLLYAGKYSAPDYEMILAEGCSLAIENSMIYRAPEVQEQLERFDIPVLVDLSSYESEPLGRTEWVKLYGALTGKAEEAEAVFNAQDEAYRRAMADENTQRKTVAFFYVTSDGTVSVRKPSDYLTKLIDAAGGDYMFYDFAEADTAAELQMEAFYETARDADILLYSSTTDVELKDLGELLEKSEFFRNFKAFQEGNVFCTTKNLYQSSMDLGTAAQDLHRMIAGDGEDMTYIYRLR